MPSLLRHARALLGAGMVGYILGVLLETAPWRLGGNYAYLALAARLIVLSIGASLLLRLAGRLLGGGRYRLAASLSFIGALAMGALTFFDLSFAWSEYSDAVYWAGIGADIRPEAALGIAVMGLAAIPLSASMVLALRVGGRAGSLPRSSHLQEKQLVTKEAE